MGQVVQFLAFNFTFKAVEKQSFMNGHNSFYLDRRAFNTVNIKRGSGGIFRIPRAVVS